MSTAVSKTNQGTQQLTPRTTYEATYVPRFDIWESDEELVLYGDLPGVAPEDLDVTFENQQLTIHGRVAPRHDGREWMYGEYGIGDFHQTFTVSEQIMAERISAELHSGVLTLRLPKSDEAKPRKITVQAND